MGLQLPGELVEMLALIGLTWPEADEEKLFELGQAWLELSPVLQTAAAQGGAAAEAVWSGNSGQAVEAFQRYWTEHGVPSALDLSADGVRVLGVGLIVYAAIVLALKINVIVQLTILAVEIAQAVATAAPTFGASLLEIPVFQQLTRAVVEELIWQVIGEIIGG
ncbi:WXG100-like domain-containing protein [Micromonospora siamensis]|uniref:Outer membrane channel protein CpnT-like N-terminal domain-containing protein n=1 Tax=Micromonospora siamensis TaxID=299152 RepID=A0A1C5JVH0_9ACTN|nr:hypothetical protein [Micromonospora siamensis]SCG74483.1 hypothetical protein GA0074704_5047 [Micromonospora siamensis]